MEFIGVIIFIAIAVIGSLVEKYGKSLPSFPPAFPEGEVETPQGFPPYGEAQVKRPVVTPATFTYENDLDEGVGAPEMTAPEYASTEGESSWSGDVSQFILAEADDEGAVWDDQAALNEDFSEEGTEQTAWSRETKVFSALSAENLVQAVIMKEILSRPSAVRGYGLRKHP